MKQLAQASLVWSVLLFASPISWAIDQQTAFADPDLQARYDSLTQEIRCLVCQNQTIADSNAPLAADLKREIRELLQAGSTDKVILAFLVDRYGDFVLYRPPVQSNTWALWAAPVVLVLIGLGIFVRIVMVRAREPLDEEPIP